MFSRRNFFKFFSGIPFIFFPNPRLKWETETDILLIEEYVAGFQYYDGMKEVIFRKLRPGDELILQREKKNPYDENALAIFTKNGEKLGYVPRALNQIPANLADQRILLTAIISEINQEAETWLRVRVKIFMRINK